MKTVFYANIDGYDIVLGIADAVLDVQATAALIAEPLLASEEVKALQAQNAKLDAAYKSLMPLMVPGAPQDAVAAIQYQIKQLADEIPATIAPAIDAKRQALMAQYAVWCQPGGCENLITEEAAEALQAAQKPGFKIKLDGTLVPDNRGATYWTNAKGAWTSTTITNLGDTVPNGATLDADLTDDQKAQITAQLESARVAELTQDQKTAEATAQVQAAKQTVASVQSQVTAGVSQSSDLTAALAAYKTQLAAINSKYSTNLN